MTLDVGGSMSSSPFFEYSMPSGSKLRAHLLSPADGKVQDLMREKGYWKEFISIHRSGGEFVSIKRSELLSYLRQQEGSEEVKAIAEGRLNSCEIPLEEGEFYALMSLESSSISGGASDSSWMKQVEESEEALGILERRYEKRLAASEPGSRSANQAEFILSKIESDRKKLEEFGVKEGEKCFADISLDSSRKIDGMGYARKLIAAIESDDLEKVRELLEEAACDGAIIDLDVNEVSVVNYALRKGNGEIVRSLLLSPCVLFEEADATHSTPLETAIQLHRIDDAKSILSLFFSQDIKGVPQGEVDGFYEKWVESIDAIDAGITSHEERIDRKDLVLEAVRMDLDVFRYLPVRLKGDRAVVLVAISAFVEQSLSLEEDLLPLIDKELLNDKEVIRALVSKEGMIYSSLSLEKKADREIALLALNSSKPINDFSLLSPSLLRDRELLFEFGARYPMQWDSISKALLLLSPSQREIQHWVRQGGHHSDFVPIRQCFRPTLYLRRDDLVATLRRMNPSETCAAFIERYLNGEKALEALDFRALLLLAQAPLESSSIDEQFDAYRKQIDEVDELHVILKKTELRWRKKIEVEAKNPASIAMDSYKATLLVIEKYRKQCELLTQPEKKEPLDKFEREMEGLIRAQKMLRAIKSNDFDRVKLQLSYFEKNQVKFAGGLDGSHILFEVIRRGNQKIIQLLINSPSANLDGGDRRGSMTPLMVAAQEGDIQTVKTLLKNGAKLQTYDPVGRSALSFAYGHVREQLLKEYEKRGIDPSLETNYQHYMLLAGVHGMKLDVELGGDEIATLESGAPAIAGLDALQLVSNATPEQLSIDEFERRELLDGLESAKLDPRLNRTQSHTEQQATLKNREVIIQSIIEGKTAIINAGWDLHAIAIVITGDYLHICNRGAGRETLDHTPAIVSYKIDRKTVSPWLLNEIFKHTSGSGQEGLPWIYKTLPKLIKGESDELTRYLELSSISIQFQSVNNCWVASTKTAVLALLASIRMKKAQSKDKPLGDAYISAYRSYKKFTSLWRTQSSLALHQAWSSDSSITLNQRKKEEFFQKLEISMKKQSSWSKDLVAGKLTYRDLLTRILKKEPFVLADLTSEQRKDREIVLKVIELCNDEWFSLEYFFPYFDPSLFSDREVVEAIVGCEGGLYAQLPLKMRSDREIILLAIKSQNPLDDLSSLPKHLLLDREIMLEFLVRHPSQWNKLEKELRYNRDFVTDLFQLLTTQKKYPAELHSSAQQIFNSLTPTLKANKGVVKAYRHFQHLLKA